MATFTSNLSLRKPATTDMVDVTTDIAANMDLIDTAVAGKAATGHGHTGTLEATARVAVKKNGTLVGTRRGVNLIEGTNVTLTVADDSGNEEVDVTIAATGGGAVTYATTAELADVAAAESAGTSATTARGDHVHAHGSGYLPNAHHNQAHSDADHTGANKVAVEIAGVAVGTRNTINLIKGNGINITGVDDAGNGEVDVTFAVTPSILTAVKTSDESVTSSTTLQDDDELFFAMAANETWTFELSLIHSGDTTGDLKVGMTLPAGATATWGPHARWHSNVASGSPGSVLFIQTDTIDQATAVDTVGYGTTYRGVVFNSTTAGNFQFRWAQNTSNAVATTVKRGSHLIAHKVAG